VYLDKWFGCYSKSQRGLKDRVEEERKASTGIRKTDGRTNCNRTVDTPLYRRCSVNVTFMDVF
jgi:hypothetical protein